MSDVLTVVKPKHAGGRPTLFRPGHCETVIELGRLGYSKARMAAHFDVAKQTIEQWAKDYPEFSDALTRARTHSQSWWEAKAQSEGLESRDFNTPLYIGSMKSMFREDYTDRTVNEMVGKDGEELKLSDSSEAARAIAFMLGRAVGRQEKAASEQN